VGELFSHVQQHDLLKFGIIPELIGRLPVVASLNSLGRDDLVRILTEPKNAMSKQYKVLMSYDGVDLEYEPSALEAIADKAIINFDVERPISIRALERAMEADQQIFLVTQREVGVDVPEEKDLYEVGTVAHISQILRVSPTSVRVLVEGQHRARLRRLWQTAPFLQANVEQLAEEEPPAANARTPRTEALLRQTSALFGEYAELAGSIPREVQTTVLDGRDPGYLADFIAQNINLRSGDKQEILEELSPFLRLRRMNAFLARENNVLSFEHELEGKVRDELERSQRDQILRTQIKVMQNELGEQPEDDDDELAAYRRRITALHLSKEAERQLTREVDRIAKQPFGSAEAAVSRNYLDVCLEMPWNKTTRERLDVEQARKILDRDHFGLTKVKERVLESLAVRQMNPEGKGQILCLVGPPGTGKTSIAMSIARATNRKLVRISLGGVHDEAEIRGHRKTYIGAMPGRIMAGIIQAKSSNPLMVLDEIDKLGSDYRGDPSAALLEALDGEQNSTFRDNFLEIPWDLSKVFFITTANTTETIPRALLDRMEVIELSSYTDEEKLQIASSHLLPKQRKKHGLKASQLKVGDDAIRAIISLYTRESGVRVLERELASMCRRAATGVAEGKFKSMTVRTRILKSFWAWRNSSRTRPTRPTRSVLCAALPGPRWAARCWTWRSPWWTAPASWSSPAIWAT
jgi:ATP-dependent Lon protease